MYESNCDTSNIDMSDENKVDYNYYSLLSNKLQGLKNFRDKLLIYTTAISLTILSISISMNEIYPPIIGSIVAFIFFIKWYSVKRNIYKLSSYLRVYYNSNEGGCWESDISNYNRSYENNYSIDNLSLYGSWIVLALVPFVTSLGIYLLRLTEGQPGINEFAVAFLTGSNLILITILILAIAWIIFVARRNLFNVDLTISNIIIHIIEILIIIFSIACFFHASEYNDIIFAVSVIIILTIAFINIVDNYYLLNKKLIKYKIFTYILIVPAILFLIISPFCNLIVTEVIDSPSVLIILITELIVALFIAILVLKLGLATKNTDKIDEQWKLLCKNITVIKGDNLGAVIGTDAIVNRSNISQTEKTADTKHETTANEEKQEYKFCIYCGEKLPMKARFCMRCGEKQE